MSRIQLRNCSVFLVDGFKGTAKVNQPSPAPANGNTTLVIDTLAGTPQSVTMIPVGAGFSVVGSSRVRYQITAVNNNEQQTVTITNATGGTFTLTFSGQTTAAIAYNAAAAAVQTALENLSNIAPGDVVVTGSAGGPWTVEFQGVYAATDVALMTVGAASLLGTNEKQTVAIDDATSSGTFTLTYSGQTTAAIAYNANAAAVQSALEALSNIEVGDVEVTGGPGPGTDWVVEFKATLGSTDVAMMTGNGTLLVGGSTTVTITETIKGVTPASTCIVAHPGATTWKLTFTPALATADGIPADDAVITLLPQYIEIKVGDGDAKYTEGNTYVYDKDRGMLDTVREGDDVPVDVSLSFTFEHVKTGSGEAITPIDALKKENGAVGWYSSSDDQCEPYSVDVVIINDPPCGVAQSENWTFTDFRSEKRDFDIKNASIAVSGKCNAVEPTITRGAWLNW